LPFFCAGLGYHRRISQVGSGRNGHLALPRPGAPPGLSHPATASQVDNMQLSIVSLDGDFCRVASEGDISLIDQIRANNPLEKLLGQGCFSRKILFNIEKSSYIDSSGVSWLIKCHKLCQAEGGKLFIHSIPPTVMGILKLLRMDQVLTLVEDDQAATQLAQGETT
jgi:anti-anti-sigma factor